MTHGQALDLQLQLPVDEVAPRDHLRDAVLHLQPRVDLQEVELVGVLVHQELYGAR